MKKIFTLFAAALVGVCAFAQTTKLVYVAEEGTDPAMAKILVNVENSRDNLNTIQQGIVPQEGVTFVKSGTGMKKAYFFGNGAYILAMYPDVTDDDRNTYLTDFADVMSNVNNGNLIIVTGLKTQDCYVYPAYDGNLGYFTVDVSAMPDGDIQIGTLSADPNLSTYGTADAQSNAVEETPIMIHKDGNNISPVTGISVVDAVKNVTSVKYYNLQGIESATPFDGVNIMVKTFEDGTKATSKVVK